MRTPLLISLLWTAASLAAGIAGESGKNWTELEGEFRDLPMEARRLTGPLFWLHGDESRDRLEMYIGKIAEGGNGSFTTESRPHDDWLGPGWWRDLDISLAAAKQHNLQLWIFDEKWWPSQGVAGKVPPQYAAKRLEASATEIEGPRSFQAEGYGGDRYIATVAGRVNTAGKLDGATLIDLAGKIRKGHLQWQVPQGKWRIMKFTHIQAPGLGQGGGKQLAVDGASKDCVDWFLQTVYQPHYDHYKKDFGKTIRGYFYDEPETPGDWGTEVNRVLSEWKVDWKKAYVAYKFELAGEEQVAARYQYLDAFAEAWGRTMYGGMTRWCEKHEVKSIGHFMEHSLLYQRPEFCAGDMMRLQGYSSMGAIDAVFDQFVMGKRLTRDTPCWQTPKLASSISHAYGKQDDIAMVEIFGARGQNLTYPEMKWWADHMQVSGVNFLIPHSFNPRSPRDKDCPPYFYNGGFEPRWPLYRVFADYTSRLSLMLTGGRHVCPVALLYLGQSAHTGKHVLPDQISESSQDALYDCDWMPYEVFEKQAKVGRNELKLRNENYRVLVVPPVETIPYPVLAKARDFFEGGGVVLSYDFLPSKSATLGRSAADIANLREAIWGSPAPGLHVCKTNAHGGRSYLLPPQPTPEQLQTLLAKDAGMHASLEVLEGETSHWLHVLHRVKDGRDIFFIANQNHEGAPRSFKFRVTAAGVPECWDAMRNEITSVPFKRADGAAELSLTFEPNESVLLVFQPKARPLPPRNNSGLQATATLPLARLAVAPEPQPSLPPESRAAAELHDCCWVWYPEELVPPNAPPSTTRYFRKQITLPQAVIKKAAFFGTADNSLTLYVNGKTAGRSDGSAEGWRNPVERDLSALLKPGLNQLAIMAKNAANAGNTPNAAGLMGRVEVEFDSAPPLSFSIDTSWKTSKDKADAWLETSFDDHAWATARELGKFGCEPWGQLEGKLTLSPIKAADPFVGNADLSGEQLSCSRVYLQTDELKPELAARVTVNGTSAGGWLGTPCRLDVTRYLKPGKNTVRIEPFAPASATLVLYRKE